MQWGLLCEHDAYLRSQLDVLQQNCLTTNVVYHRLGDYWSFTVTLQKQCEPKLWFYLQKFLNQQSFCAQIQFQVAPTAQTITQAYGIIQFVLEQTKPNCHCFDTLALTDITLEPAKLTLQLPANHCDHSQIARALNAFWHQFGWSLQQVIWTAKPERSKPKQLNPLVESNELGQKATFEGTIFKIETVRTKYQQNNYMVYLIAPNQAAMLVRVKKSLYHSEYQVGAKIQVIGTWEVDRYAQMQRIVAQKIKLLATEPERLDDLAPTKRIELHLHTKMSAMDGLSTPAEYFALADQYQHAALAFTDHENVQAYPDIYACAQKYPHIKAIYGVQFNVIDKDIPYIRLPQPVHFEQQKIVVFDLETTGLNPQTDEIIEFGALVYENINANGVPVDFLIKPQRPLSSFTIKLTHITNEMLAEQPDITTTAAKIFAVIEDAVLVAHNADFDMSFLHQLAKRMQRPPLTNMVIDTLRLAWALIPSAKNYRLGTVAKKLNIDYDELIAHRADYDAQVLAKIFLSFLDQMQAEHHLDHFDQIKRIHQDYVYRRIHSTHMTVLAKNNAGLKAIFQLVSDSYTQTFFRQPKVFRQQLQRDTSYRQDILVGSSCYHNEIFQQTHDEATLATAIRFYDYIEIQPLSCYQPAIDRQEITRAELIAKIKTIIAVAEKCQVLVVATGDVHYAKRDQSIFREIYIYNKGIGGSRHPLYDHRQRIKTYPVQAYENTATMQTAFAFLNDPALIERIVITNPHRINEQIEPVTITKKQLYTPTIANAAEKLRQLCYQNARVKYGLTLPPIIAERLEQELTAICHHGYAVIYWIAHQLVDQSLQDGFLVGSRGSVGSSVAAYMANITEVNPLAPHYRCVCTYSQFDNLPPAIRCGYDLPPQQCPQCERQMFGDGHNIPFATFLGFNADKVPDIDLNFSGVYQNKAHEFIKQMFGAAAVFRAGTISTVAEKTAFGYVKNYLEVTNQQQNYNYYQIVYLAQGCVGVKRTTGQHPGGIIIIPQDYSVLDFTPYNFPADDQASTWYTTHFDFNSLHDNLLKLDILGHLDPTALKMLHDLTKVDPKTVPPYDPAIIELFRSSKVLNITDKKRLNNEVTGAISLPEFGTNFVRQMLKETQPESFADLVQISGLSHGTDVWRGNAQQLIKQNLANISNVIGCRDDIMTTLIVAGVAEQKAFAIMEQVRKGRGIKPDDCALLLEHDIPQWYIDSCQKIKYLFPKAHATAYVLMAWRIAWYKIHFPYEYYATFLSTRTANFNWKMLLERDYTKIIQAIQQLRQTNNSTVKDHELIVLYEVLLEMKARNITIGNLDIHHSAATDFLVHTASDDTKVIIVPFIVVDGLGNTVAENIVTARQQKPFQSYADFKKRTSVNITSLKLMTEMQVFAQLDSNQMNLFD